jgi:hypothetical protein
MSILRFHRNRNRQQDPFVATEITHPSGPRPGVSYDEAARRMVAEMRAQVETEQFAAQAEAEVTAIIDQAHAEARAAAVARQGVHPAVPIAADYQALPVFRNTVRDACGAGLKGIGTRGVHPIPPLPDYGLDRFTTGPWEDVVGPEFDQVAARMEAGFYQARRMFHRADTAGFPAVAA